MGLAQPAAEETPLPRLPEATHSFEPPISLLTIAEMSLADKLSRQDRLWALDAKPLGLMPQLISPRCQCVEPPIVQLPLCKD